MAFVCGEKVDTVMIAFHISINQIPNNSSDIIVNVCVNKMRQIIKRKRRKKSTYLRVHLLNGRPLFSKIPVQ